MRPEQAKAALCGNAQAVIRRARTLAAITAQAQIPSRHELSVTLTVHASQTRLDKRTAAPCPSPSSSWPHPRSANANEPMMSLSPNSYRPRPLRDLLCKIAPRTTSRIRRGRRGRHRARRHRAVKRPPAFTRTRSVPRSKLVRPDARPLITTASCAASDRRRIPGFDSAERLGWAELTC